VNRGTAEQANAYDRSRFGITRGTPAVSFTIVILALLLAAAQPVPAAAPSPARRAAFVVGPSPHYYRGKNGIAGRVIRVATAAIQFHPLTYPPDPLKSRRKL
jgi:hypothetical protein